MREMILLILKIWVVVIALATAALVAYAVAAVRLDRRHERRGDVGRYCPMCMRMHYWSKEALQSPFQEDNAFDKFVKVVDDVRAYKRERATDEPARRQKRRA